MNLSVNIHAAAHFHNGSYQVYHYALHSNVNNTGVDIISILITVIVWCCYSSLTDR